MGKKSSRATRLCDTPVACLDEGAERFQFLQTLISIGGGRPLSPTNFFCMTSRTPISVGPE